MQGAKPGRFLGGRGDTLAVVRFVAGFFNRNAPCRLSLNKP
jgi:hypothetical protein